jgi:peptidoglycan LD-endopeptidase LytH
LWRDLALQDEVSNRLRAVARYVAVLLFAPGRGVLIFRQCSSAMLRAMEGAPMKREIKTALATAGFLLALGVGSVLSVPSAPHAAVRPKAAMPVAVVHEIQQPRALIVPIAGVAASDLVDTWGAPRSGGRHHEGVDIMAPTGTPVRAAADGRIVKLFTSELGGLTVYQLDAAGRLILYYAHLSAYAPDLTVGMAVKQGQVIASVGQTGNATTPHLHFEVQRANPGRQWWRGQAVNPYRALVAGRVDDDRPSHASLGGRSGR